MVWKKDTGGVRYQSYHISDKIGDRTFSVFNSEHPVSPNLMQLPIRDKVTSVCDSEHTTSSIKL